MKLFEEFIHTPELPEEYKNISTRLYYMTPKEAQEIENKSNFQNRPKQPSTIAHYKNDIICNNWRINSSPICLDVSGGLFQGGHRIRAIIEANKAVWVNLSTGWPVNNLDRIPDDRLRKRTVADISNIFLQHSFDGYKVTSNHTAIARLIQYLPKFPAKHSNKSDFEYLQALVTYRDLIFFAVDLTLNKGGNRIKGSRSAGYSTLLARAVPYVAKEEIIRFHKIVNDPTFQEGSKDVAATRLHNYMVNSWSHEGDIDKVILYRKSQNALYHFTKGNEIKNLSETQEDLFPLVEQEKQRQITNWSCENVALSNV